MKFIILSTTMQIKPLHVLNQEVAKLLEDHNDPSILVQVDHSQNWVAGLENWVTPDSTLRSIRKALITRSMVGETVRYRWSSNGKISKMVHTIKHCPYTKIINYFLTEGYDIIVCESYDTTAQWMDNQ
jgi:hypothetical protein